MKHIISVLVENRAGVLAHIAGLFSSRGYNIDSLAVGRTENPNTSRMTIVVDGDEAIIEQIHKQLDKLVPVLKVTDFSKQSYVDRDLMLIKVSATPSKRVEIMKLAEVFRGKVVHVGPKEMIIEIAGSEDKLEALIEVLSPYGIKELVRTGTVAMLRGNNA
jgi:acetolactate synthase I/III small subunit